MLFYLTERMKQKMQDNIIILDHPLIQHKITMMRDSKTGTNEFRNLTEEVCYTHGV